MLAARVCTEKSYSFLHIEPYRASLERILHDVNEDSSLTNTYTEIWTNCIPASLEKQTKVCI